MSTWIALFRGINVGGNNPLPMKTLPALLEKCGCTDAKTYIQSGNAVFRSSAKSAETLGTRIGKAVKETHGFQPRVIVLSCKELERAMQGNPYAEVEQEPRWVHLFFLAGPPQKSGLALEKLKSLQKNGESFVLKGQVFYLHTPAGFGTSKLAEAVVRQLGVEATARNWRTCQKVLELAKTLD